MKLRPIPKKSLSDQAQTVRTPKNMFKGKPLRIAAILIFLAATIFYGIFILNLSPGKIAFTKYQVAAEQYLNGTIQKERILDFSPLYLYLNIFARQFVENPPHFMLWIQIILVSLAAVLLFLLLKLFFNWTLSIVGAIAFVTNKSIILYSITMEPEPLIIFFILGFVYFGTRTIITRSSIYSILSGLFLGLSVFTRLNFFPLVLVIPIYLLIKYWDNKKWLRPVLMFGIPVLVLMSFLMLRNSSMAGSFTLIQMNPGQVIYEGNNPNSLGESAIYPPLVKEFANQFPDQADFEHAIYRFFARSIKNEPLSINQVNWFWTKKG
ncbi:MAG TPA: glycosyltransferase family 39 protein, partial [Candidatus Kapabacteria bacterium]|nr:glycosyltransferase family 39 protein [Candidatus Kapabacteria bacterium]